jgi:hypothetical protein
MNKTFGDIMKAIFGDIKNILIVVLVVILIFMKSCGGGGGIRTVTTPGIVRTNTVMTYDTIIKEIPKYIPKLVTKIVREVDSIIITQPIDTSAILEDYFATYVYTDIQSFDSLKLQITDSVSQNKIVARTIKYDIIYPTLTITQTKFIKQHEFFVGLGLAGRTTQFNYLGAHVLWKTKWKPAIAIGVGLDNEFKVILSTQILWKIGK